jgi:hypothetical protein
MCAYLLSRNGACCPCSGVGSDPCDCGFIANWECRNRGGNATLLGFPEFCEPSIPAKFYLETFHSGRVYLYGHDLMSQCPATPLRDAEVYCTGEKKYSRATGLVTVDTVNCINGAGPYAQRLDCGEAPNCLGAEPFERLIAKQRGDDLCCDVGFEVRRVTGERVQTIAEEDTEEDAIRRLKDSVAGQWTEWLPARYLPFAPHCLPPQCCRSAYALRTTTPDFAWREAEWRMEEQQSGHPGLYTVEAVYYRRKLDVGVMPGPWELWLTEELGVALLDNFGRVATPLFEGETPLEKGYETYLEKIVFRNQ